MKFYIENKNINVYGVPQEYEITEGAVFVKNYNETLDSGTILIQQLSAPIEIEPYDIVVIDDTKRYCVDEYTCTMTMLNNIYKYEIKLFSETKKLEGIILPSLAITKKMVGSQRTVWQYISRYNDLYSPKTSSNEYDGATGNLFTLGTSLDRFKTINCPEMQWNEPTFREVLTDLMMVDDCIPILTNNVIECLDISGTPETFDTTYVNYIQENQSSDDYVSEIKMNLVNVANNETNGGSRATRIVENIGFRNRDSYLLTTENMRLETNFPIWNLFECKIKLAVHSIVYYSVGADYEKDADLLVDLDITRYISEYSKWLTKEVYYGAWSVGTQDLDPEYRNRSLYYKRGSRDIENFNTKVENQWLFIQNTLTFFEMLLETSECQDALDIAGEEYFNENILPDEPTATYTDTGVNWDANHSNYYKTCEFTLEYEPIDECVFTATKSLTKNKRTIVDNQTNSYVDINRQGLLEYLKANRLGNKMLLINARYPDGVNIPELPLAYGDYTIFRKETSVYKNYTECNFIATKDYILRNYFTGVKSKLRSWRVVEGNQALTRKELLKFYINDDIASVENIEQVIPSGRNIQWFLDNFKYCAIQFRNEMPIAYDRNDIYPHTFTIINGAFTYDTNAILVEFSKHVIDNKSVIFTINMNDNYFAGTFVKVDEPRVEQLGIRYCDDDGEIVGGYICFYNSFDFTIPTIPLQPNLDRTLKPLTNIGNVSEGTGAYGPPANVSSLVAKIPFKVYKDNKEILQISIQFEFNDEANDMFIGYKEEEDAEENI